MRLRDLGLRSLQARLMLGAFAWIAVGLLVSGLAISGIFREYVRGQFHHELEDHLTELQGLSTVGAGGALSILRPVSDPRFAFPGSGYYWEIWNAGQPVLRSESLAGRDLTDAQLRGMDVARRSVAIPPAKAPFAFVVAGDTRDLTAVVARFHRLLAISLSVIAMGLGGAAAAQVGFGLYPLRRLRLSLGEVRRGKASALAGDFPQEVRPLVNDLNALISAQADMSRRARTQAGNLGHALRTPLAILMAEARSLAELGQVDAAERIVAECRAMSRQVDYQVARARAAGSRAGIGTDVLLASEAAKVIAAMEKLWAERYLAFHNDIPADLAVTANADDLGEILANLLDNAAKWAVHDIRLSGGWVDQNTTFVVEDDGPGVPESHWEAVLRLGERLDEQKPGSGLGLAIVKDIVDLYGGQVALGRSRLGGLKVSVSLPMRTDAKATAGADSESP